jgi:hypothetical protein
MSNLFKPASEWKWYPDADSVGAPEGVLLRADNTVPDQDGALSLRLGSAPIYQTLQDLRVQTLHTVELNNTIWRLIGAGNQVYANGSPIGGAFGGSGDIVFGDDSYQAFAARGPNRLKWDGETFNNWSIAAPSIPAVVAAVDAITDTVATFATAESPGFTAQEGTKTYVTGQDLVASGAMKLVPNAGTGRASATKNFSSNQNYMDIGGAPGGGTDLFDFRVWFEDWRKVEKVTVMFGLGTGADAFADDYYYFDWNLRDQDTVNIKDAASNAAAAFAIASGKSLNVLTPQEVTNIRTPDQAAEVLRRLGRFAGPRSTERRDALEASPAWGHLSVTKGQFNRVGGTSGKNWSTVRAFKVVYVAIPGSTESVYFDSAIWIGGGARSLTGTFRVGYRFARRFAVDDRLVYYELSPMSPVSGEITLNQQTLSVTISATALAGKDPQVGEVWAYLQGGWLDTYYRFAVLPASPSTGMTIDELSNPIGGDFGTPEKRVRLTSWGFTHAPGEGAGATSVVFTGGVSELEILIDNEPYVPGSVPVPENIVSIAGPWNGRMFVLDNQGYLWPSGSSPSTFSAYHTVDLRKYGTPLWLAKTANGITAGFTKDVIRIAGSGDESDNRVIIDLYGDPLNVGNPPVDSSFMTDGNTIVYRAADGLMALSGQSLSPVPFAGTALLWRGQNRHGVSALNLSGRYRFAVDNHILYMLAPEGSTDPTAVWRYNFDKPQWGRNVYPFTPLSIHRDPGGQLIVGTADGAVWEIETGSQDGTADIPVDILTPIGYGSDPLRRKDSADFQIHVNTAGESGTASFMKDGDATASVDMAFSTSAPRVFRSALDDLGVFLKLQMRITGSFNQFSMQAYNITYRSRPQQVMVLDPGYIVPANGGDIAWLNEAEIDCISPADISLLIYRDDVLYRTLPVVVKPRVRSAYRVALPRGTKSRRLRLVLKATNAAGDADPGFEPYSMRVRHRGTGNMTELPITMGDDS